MDQRAGDSPIDWNYYFINIERCLLNEVSLLNYIDQRFRFYLKMIIEKS